MAMQVIRVTDNTDETTYDVRGLTERQMELLGALADFPMWFHQPREVAEFCEALHNTAGNALAAVDGPWPFADAVDMKPLTTV